MRDRLAETPILTWTLQKENILKMKIIYLHQYFITPQSSGGTRSFEFARRLLRMGHSVHVISSSLQKGNRKLFYSTKETGIDVHWISVPYDNNMSFRRRIYSFFSFAVFAFLKGMKLNGDVIFATSTPLTIAIPALLISKLKRIPMVFEVRDLWPSVPIAMGIIKNPISVFGAKLLERAAYKNSKYIVALAPGMKKEIVKTGISKDKVVVIPNGCDFEYYETDANRGEFLRSEYPWLDQRPLVIYFGAIGIANGVDYFVRLAKTVHGKAKDICFVVIGEGKQKETVISLSKQLNIYGNNFFLLPPVPKKEIPRWVSTSDLVVALFTGSKEIWQYAVQNKFFDAIAAGKPVACNFNGWQAQIAQKAKAGIILDAQNIENAAEEIISAISNKSWLEEAGKAARNLAENHFNRDKLAQKLEAVLKAAVFGDSAHFVDDDEYERLN